MNMFRMILFIVLGVMLWRAVRLFSKMTQGARRREEDPVPPRVPTKAQMDLRDVQEAHFEDITPKEEGREPPSKK